MAPSSLERAWETRWVQLAPADAPVPVVEYQFHPPRRWRFDIAFVGAKVAIELDGGVHTNGRHVRGQGFENDCRKLNQAALDRWVVLRFTSSMLASDPAACIGVVLQALGVH